MVELKIDVSFDRASYGETEDCSSELLEEIRKVCKKFYLLEKEQKDGQDNYSSVFVEMPDEYKTLTKQRNELNRKISEMKKEKKVEC